MDVFTIRDLRERTGDLSRRAEAARLSVVTKQGEENRSLPCTTRCPTASISSIDARQPTSLFGMTWNRASRAFR